MTETIFACLKDDHDQHRQLLEQIGSASPNDRATLFETFRIEVTAHAAAEEETLYATMLARPELRHDATHSVAEHKEIGDFFEELQELDATSDAWTSKFGELRHRYEHHIDEEEEEMFPAAEDGLSTEKVEALAHIFARRKPAEIERAEQGADAGDERE